jgi:predicted HAD superfamily Cof-like phosphohydrolase
LQATGSRLVTQNRGLLEALEEASDAVVAHRVDRRRADVMRFMAEVANSEIGTSPHVPPLGRLRALMRIHMEECIETLEAAGADARHVEATTVMVKRAIDSIDPKRTDLVALADGLIDTLYTAEHTLIGCGIDSGPLWRVVAENNLAKRGGPVVNGKLQKPPGHMPPDIEGALRAQGYRP